MYREKGKYNARKAIKTAKIDYKMESQYGGSDTRHTWQGLRAITDCKGSSRGITNTDPSEPTTKMANHPEDYVLQLSESEVRRIFRRVKAGKAAGPDGVPPASSRPGPAGSCVLGHLQRNTAAVCHPSVFQRDNHWGVT